MPTSFYSLTLFSTQYILFLKIPHPEIDGTLPIRWLLFQHLYLGCDFYVTVKGTQYGRPLEFPSCFLSSLGSSHSNFFSSSSVSSSESKGGYISIRKPFGNACVFNQLSIPLKNRARPWEIILCFGSLTLFGRKLQCILSSAPFQVAKLCIFIIVLPRRNSELVPPSSSIHILPYFIQRDFATPVGSVRTVNLYNSTRPTHFFRCLSFLVFFCWLGVLLGPFYETVCLQTTFPNNNF